MISFVSLAAVIAFPATGWTDWSSVPLEKWTKAKSMDATISLQATPGVWAERDGHLIIEGRADCWDTRLAPGNPGADTQIMVDFTIEQSSRVVRRLPVMQTARWAYHYGENAPGWDFGIVLRRTDPLDFYRIGLSGHRGELALWDSLGEFLQFVPCPVKIGKPHRIEVVCHGARFIVTLDGRQVLDYVDRSLPHAGGQVGLAVWRSKVTVRRFEVSRIAPDAAPVPPHRPDFHFEQDGTTAILFDGNEPISRYFKSTDGEGGALFQSCVKLQPGGRTVYYTWLGPAITPGPGHGVLPLVGDLPDAFNVTKRGEELHFTFRTDRPDTAKADHECAVRYDAQRGVYRYEYHSHLTFTVAEPFEINAFELIDLPMDTEPVRAVYDASHNGHHLMLAGNPQWMQENGRGFLRLDGSDDGATIPLKPKLQALDCKVPMGQIKTLFPLEAFTYEFWARPQVPVGGPGAHAALLNYRWNVNLDFSQFNEADKTCRLYYQNDRRNPNDRWQATGHVRIERRVPYAEWLHIVATHADGRVVLYVDGEPAGQATYDTDTPGFEFFMFEPAYHIGWTYGGGRHYRGDIGPIRLSAKALSAEEVAERYQAGWCGQP